jgi:hypothetical protein
VRFVLLHSPLLGPYSWRACAEALTARGHAASAPAWPRLSTVEGDLYRHLADAMAATIAGAGGEPPVLVAHSAAGALLPALAAALDGATAGAIFCDAILPHPGRSWFDTVPAEQRTQLRAGAADGLLPSWDQWWPPGALERLIPDDGLRAGLVAELEPTPVEYFETPAPQAELAGPAAYLRLSGAYDDDASVAGRMGWPVVRLPLNHLAILTRPDTVAASLEGLAAQLAG